MTFNTNINGVLLTVTVSLWGDRPAEITGVKIRSMVGNLKPILAADAFEQLSEEIRASAEWRYQLQRPDESATFDSPFGPVCKKCHTMVIDGVCWCKANPVLEEIE